MLLILAGLTALAAESPHKQADPLLAVLPETFRAAASQYQKLLDSVKGSFLQPRSFDQGRVKLVGPKDWTSGFFPGSLWYLYEYTGDGKWAAAARDYTSRLESIKNFREHHDVGFMLGCSYGNGWRLTQDPAYREVLIQGARSLSTRFNPRVGLIRSWDSEPGRYLVIIDNMMNLELLIWAARESGEASLREVALQHADNTLRHHFREDFSSYHLVNYNPTNGSVTHRQTVQGAADTSAWARGQAWGVYGFTTMYRESRRPEYLARAENIARFILQHPRLPIDGVPYWDFDAPDIPNAPRDASAAAIMASALTELSGLTQGDLAEQCRSLARRQLLSLASSTYFAKPGENGGFLIKHAVGHFPAKSEVDVPLNYADYYFLEGLLRYRNAVESQNKPADGR